MAAAFDSNFSFNQQLWYYYTTNRGKIRSRYNDLTRKFLAYNDSEENPHAFLRKPQFEALEMYVFVKEFMNNKQVYEMFDDWRNRRDRFSDASYYAVDKGGQIRLFDAPTEKQTDTIFKQMKKYREDYPNYIYALTMGLGKTILMATCIFYEFLLAKKYPRDKRFCHNALVFAPDKTVLQSLREIMTFDKTKVVPPEYARVLDANIKFHFLDESGTILHADPIGYENVKSEEFLTTVVTTFWERYGGRIYDGLNPKLAIYAAGVEEAVTEVKPALERILAKLGVPASKILLNVGDAKYTKNDDIRDFNNLDVPGTEGNEKQFIILVEKGKEGWNCRSLFGVALFRSPKSKIFVLQATMRCLRAITDERLTATVFLSKENFDTLDDELHKNFNMEIKDIKKPSNDNRHKYQVRVLPPPRTITLKRIWHEYTLHKKEYSQPVDFKLAGADLSKYASTMYERDSLARDTTVKEKNIDYLQENMKYSEYSLAGEVARYLNISCILAAKILRESVDGADVILDAVNRYNAVLDDYIIPGVFHALFDITAELKTEDKELVLLREPKEAGYYEFSAKDDLVITNRYPGFTPDQIKKSFHADTYCFDSIPEKECFMQYITSGKVKEVYFTGMFTSNQGDLSVHYYDPESGRIRQYYPDFLAKMTDGSYQLIEVKGDNKIDDTVVKAKQAAAEEMAIASGIKYLMYAGSQIVNSHVLEDASDTASTISMC